MRALRREHRRPLRRLLASFRSAAHSGTPRRLKPYAEAAERNRAPILAVLERIFRDRKSVLEVGSGTGQHAAYFSAALPHLAWHASDVAAHIPDIREWVSDPPPIELDVDHPFPQVAIDAAFTANTCHILSWAQVERMFAGVAALLPPDGLFAVYGPFHYGGKPTAESNARFDRTLQAHDPLSGIRDCEAVRELARRHALELEEDNAMPANNRLLVFRKRP